MNNDKPLSNLFQLFAKGNLPRKDFEGRLFQFLLENSGRYHVFGGDRYEWNEFLSWLYPRLARAIDLYRDVESTFDAYIGSVVYSAFREYRCREADHYITESACWQARAEEMRLLESEPVYSTDENPADHKLVPVLENINPRQVLFLLLKSYNYVTDEYVQYVAGAIGIETETIYDLINEIRERRSEQEARILDLRDRLYCQHYRCLAYQKRMRYSQPGTDFYKMLKSRYERARKRYYSMKKRLGGIRAGATNRMVAEVMGIPKGTVDSGIYFLKSRLASAEKKIV